MIIIKSKEEGRRKKEEGRRKKEEGWNCNGDLNPNAILTPCDGGEFNPSARS
ncbi:MAG: hypothetical protein AAFR83_19485 [Cyanobacteria bacterium J06629_18]